MPGQPAPKKSDSADIGHTTRPTQHPRNWILASTTGVGGLVRIWAHPQAGQAWCPAGKNIHADAAKTIQREAAQAITLFS
jgi:hypothetical protein